jgi:hypothetical protein
MLIRFVIIKNDFGHFVAVCYIVAFIDNGATATESNNHHITSIFLLKQPHLNLTLSLNVWY